MPSEVPEAADASACRNRAAWKSSAAIHQLEISPLESSNEGTRGFSLRLTQWGIGAVIDSIASLETALTLLPVRPRPCPEYEVATLPGFGSPGCSLTNSQTLFSRGLHLRR